MTLDKDSLLKKMFSSEEIPFRDGTIKVRGLSRTEALAVKGKELPEEEMEQLLLSTALVDPVLTKDEVKVLQDNSPAGEIEDVIAAIMRLSGMEKGAAKSGVPAV